MTKEIVVVRKWTPPYVFFSLFFYTSKSELQIWWKKMSKHFLTKIISKIQKQAPEVLYKRRCSEKFHQNSQENTCARFCSYWNSKPLETTRNYPKPSKTILNHLKPSATIQNHLQPLTQNYPLPPSPPATSSKLHEPVQNSSYPCKNRLIPSKLP